MIRKMRSAECGFVYLRQIFRCSRFAENFIIYLQHRFALMLLANITRILVRIVSNRFESRSFIAVAILKIDHSRAIRKQLMRTFVTDVSFGCKRKSARELLDLSGFQRTLRTFWKRIERATRVILIRRSRIHPANDSGIYDQHCRGYQNARPKNRKLNSLLQMQEAARLKRNNAQWRWIAEPQHTEREWSGSRRGVRCAGEDPGGWA